MRKGADTVTTLSDMITKQEAMAAELRRMALHSTQPREKCYILKQANEAEQIAQWLREYMALREQVKKEAKE